MASIPFKILSIYLVGMAVYLLAVFFGVILKLGLGISSVTVDGRSVDVVTYLIIATIDLILFLCQTVIGVALVGFTWVWNGILVKGLTHNLGKAFNIRELRAVKTIPNSSATLFVQAMVSLRLELVGFIGNFFGDVSDGLTGLFGGAL